MKGVKKFWIGFGIVFLSFLLIVGACFGIMYLKPGISILGLKYISVESNQNFVYSPTSIYPIQNIDSIYIKTQRSNIYFSIGKLNTFIEVSYENHYSGFSRTDGSSSYRDLLINHGSADTLNIITEENYTDLVSGESTINISLPKDYDFSKITAISESGNVSFYSKNDDYSIDVDELVLSTGKYGNISIGEMGEVSSLTFNTYIGDVVFSGISEISAEKIEFNTVSGAFLLDERAETKLSTTSGFVVNATGKATVKISELASSLKLNVVAGNYSFDCIGEEDEHREVIVNADNINFSAGKIYGYVSFLDRNSYYVQNNVLINELVSEDSDLSSFSVGEGYLKISKTNANISVSSTKGNISLAEVNPQNSVYAYSETGDIDIKYQQSNFAVNSSLVKVLSKAGNINLENISCALYVNVLSSSKSKSLKVSFNALCDNKDSQIISKDRTPLLTWKGNSDDLVCSLFSKREATFFTQSGAESTFGSEVLSSDTFEYRLNEYSAYSHQYRVGYQKGSLQYASAGMLFVDGSENIHVTIVI